MINNSALIRYLAKMALLYFFIITLIICAILFITSAFDVLYKFKSISLSSADFLSLIILKIPYLFTEVVILISFVSTFMFLLNLSKTNELIAILGSGVPIWRVFIIAAIVNFIIGIFILCVIYPISTYCLQEYEKINSRIYKKSDSHFIISQYGLLFFENFAGENRIVQAQSINSKENSLSEVTVLILDDQNNFIKRIDAPNAELKTGVFEIFYPIVTTEDSSTRLEALNFPTNLSIGNLMQRFLPPEMIFIWDLKNTIAEFANSGLVVTKYQIFYYKQLFKPLAMLAMSLVACLFISLNIRDNSIARAILFSVITGVSTYFFLHMSIHILTYSGLYPVLAALLPIIFILMISNFVILHSQEA